MQRAGQGERNGALLKEVRKTKTEKQGKLVGGMENMPGDRHETFIPPNFQISGFS